MRAVFKESFIICFKMPSHALFLPVGGKWFLNASIKCRILPDQCSRDSARWARYRGLGNPSAWQSGTKTGVKSYSPTLHPAFNMSSNLWVDGRSSVCKKTKNKLGTPYDAIVCGTTFISNKYFLYGFISVLHCCREILLYCSLQHWCLRAFAAVIISFHSILIKLRSRLWLGHCHCLLSLPQC